MLNLIKQRSFKYAIILLVVYIILLFGGFFISNGNHTIICVFKNITGIPCAGCGLGRATIEIFHGNFITSFYYHIWAIPITIGALISFVWLLVDSFRKKDTYFLFFNSYIGWKAFVFFVLLMLIGWAANIIREV